MFYLVSSLCSYCDLLILVFFEPHHDETQAFRLASFRKGISGNERRDQEIPRVHEHYVVFLRLVGGNDEQCYRFEYDS